MKSPDCRAFSPFKTLPGCRAFIHSRFSLCTRLKYARLFYRCENYFFLTTCVLLQSFCFILSLHFTPGLQSTVCILPSVCILPPVCSLQSAFYTDRFRRSNAPPIRASKRVKSPTLQEKQNRLPLETSSAKFSATTNFLFSLSSLDALNKDIYCDVTIENFNNRKNPCGIDKSNDL